MKSFLLSLACGLLLTVAITQAAEPTNPKQSTSAPTTSESTTAKPKEDLDQRFTGAEYQQPFANPVDHPNLPNVLLIGDSISIGYTVEVRKQLHGKADVLRIPTNGRNAAYGLENLDRWLGGQAYDVIHFNWGLWDLCYRHPESKNQGKRDKERGTVTATPEAYRQSLEAIVEKLKETKATLIWCSTTPVPENEAGRREGDDLIYNEIAAEIMRKHGIQINDLHAHALKRLPEIASGPGNVHFSAAGSAYLAEQVAAEILKALPNQE